MNLKINYYGYFTPLGGYGIANINWVKHLKRLGVDVSPHAKFKPLPDSYEWSIMDAGKFAELATKSLKTFVGYGGDGKPRYIDYSADHLELFIPRGRGDIKSFLPR